MPKKIGIIPLAVTLIVLGISIVLTKLTGTDWFGRVLSLWPLVLIAIGAEIVWRQTRSRNGEGPAWKLDGKSIALLAVVLVLAGAIHGISSLTSSFTRNGFWDFFHDGFGPGQTVSLKDEDLALGNAQSLYIENALGSLTVEGVDSNSVHLKADARVHRSDPKEAEQRAKEIEIRVTQGNQAKIIVVDKWYKGVGFHGGNPTSVNLVLQVPKQMMVSSKTNAGSVQVTGVAEVNVETDFGKVNVQKIQGKATVRTNAGEITATDVGSADLSSDMGRVEIREVKGTVNAKTDAGEIRVSTSSPVAGDWTLETDMGAIDIEFPKNSSVRFEGRTDMGTIYTPGQKSNGPEASVEVPYGDQKYRIRATTDAGKIEVRN